MTQFIRRNIFKIDILITLLDKNVLLKTNKKSYNKPYQSLAFTVHLQGESKKAFKGDV